MQDQRISITAVSILLATAILASGCVGRGERSDNSVKAFDWSTAGGSSTADVLCDYNQDSFNPSPSVNAQSTASWSCDDVARLLISNGIPDHEVGTFPNPGNPNTISARKTRARFPIVPVQGGATTAMGGPRGAIAFMLNGVKVDAGTGGTCNDAGDDCSMGEFRGPWRIEALGQSHFDFGTDRNHEHVQPGGEYHYHGMPEGLIERLNKASGPAMLLIGWAADGFPIYARWGHATASNANSLIKIVTSSYRIRTRAANSRPPVSLYAMGSFMQDYEYVAGLGDLDECNGRQGVTPEFPQGIYHYYATDMYPYFQRCVRGEVAAGPSRLRIPVVSFASNR